MPRTHLHLHGPVVLFALLWTCVLPVFGQETPTRGIPSDSVAAWSEVEVGQEIPSEGLTLESVIRGALGYNFVIRSGEESVRIESGNVQAAEGAFDFVLDASAAREMDNTLFTQAEAAQIGASSAENALSTYRIALRKAFRSGLVVEPNVSMTRTDPVTLEVSPVVRSSVDVGVQYPLLRGRTVDAARVDAAREQRRATELELRHTTAEQLYEVAVAYWVYRRAAQSLNVYRDAEARARKLLEDTRQLVAADERPEADMAQLQANLADKVAARVSAEQRVLEARQSLGLAMSLPPEEVKTLSTPSDPFPGVVAIADVPEGTEAYAVAIEERRDLRGAQVREQTAAILRDAERNERRPRFDLRASVGYVGLSEQRLTMGSHLTPFGQSDVRGSRASVGLVYRWSPRNRAARGDYLRQDARYRQFSLESREVQRRIRAGVTIATDRLRSSILEVQSARASVALHHRTVENERKKLRLGMSTLFDVTLAEDRLTTALLNRAAAQSRYAQAVAQLRLETGLLPARDATPSDVVKLLTSIPQISAR